MTPMYKVRIEGIQVIIEHRRRLYLKSNLYIVKAQVVCCHQELNRTDQP